VNPTMRSAVRRRAGYRTRPSGLKGRCAVAARRPAAALDPGASTGPDRPATAGRPSLPAPTRDAAHKIKPLRDASTVRGDCHYTLRVHIEPATFMRHDEVNGRRFAAPVDVEFTGVKVRRGAD